MDNLGFSSSPGLSSMSLEDVATLHIHAVSNYGNEYHAVLGRRLGPEWICFENQVRKNQAAYVKASIFLSVVCLFSICFSVIGIAVEKLA